MFLRKRTYKGRLKFDSWRGWHREDTVQYQICESYRDEEGRPRQRVICSIRPSRWGEGLYVGNGSTGGLREHAAWLRSPVIGRKLTAEQVEYLERKARAMEIIADKYGNRPWDQQE
jgi:hypothetical protein